MYASDRAGSRADLCGVKRVVGADDPVMQAMFTRLKMNGVPLGVPDILPALQTGLIDGCLGPPMAMLAFQWITKVRYVTTEPMFVAVGAMVVMKKDFDRLSEADRH